VLLVALAGAGAWLRMRPVVHREPGLSVLLITVDTLRADAVGAYGSATAFTPWTDRLAASGARFENAHAHNVVTLPSHANILSGRYPTEHGVRDNSGFRFPTGMETLATLLKARGYATGAFVSAFPVAARFGLGRGFDVYDDSFVDAETRPAFLEQERAGAETVALARRWLAAPRDAPWFCWVHLYEPHYPYDPPEPFASRFPDNPYRGEVAAADDALGPLLEPLLTAGDAGRTLVVLTADHGEALGEHGEATHGIFAYEATLRVPLIFYAPILFRPRVVTEGARHVDILPTVLDALGIPAPQGLPGRSLLPVIGGEVAGPATTYFEALSGQLNRGWAPLHGVLRKGIKYIDLPLPELYDLGGDPREAQNVAEAAPSHVEEMRAALASLRPATDTVRKVPEGAETRERLRSLGYVASATAPAPRRYSADDDPKRLMALDSILREVVTLYVAGDVQGALARCRALVALRPEMTLSLLYLAHLERESGDLSAAIAALRKALVLSPDDTVTASLLGTYLTQAGRSGEAVDVLEPFVRPGAADVEVLVARGLALARMGRAPEALDALARAREADPGNAMLLVDVGTVHLMARDEGQARQAFEAALAQNPKVARAESSLGVMAGEAGRTDEALAHFRRAVSLDPRECEKLLALTTLLDRRGRGAEARPYLELFVARAPAARYGPELARVRALLGERPS
jgi:arylsulfatase A-like enzyme/Flp pilus assembly protein TadD